VDNVAQLVVNARESSLGRCILACLGVNVNINININTLNPHVTRLRATCIDDVVDDPLQTPNPAIAATLSWEIPARPALPAFYLSPTFLLSLSYLS